MLLEAAHGVDITIELFLLYKYLYIYQNTTFLYNKKICCVMCIKLTYIYLFL